MEEQTLYVTESDPTELQERLAALEMMLETVEWRVVSAQADQEFSREGLRNVTELSRILFLKNPIVKRGVLVKTSGATVSADDGRRMLLMVVASFGLPETFFGDASVGSLATAESLDRPTELMMENRQQLWRDVTLNIINCVELWAVKAPQGQLRSLGRVETTVEDGQKTEAIVWNKGVNDDVSVDFPPLVQHNIPEMVNATVNAATLGAAGVLAGTIDLPTLSRILLTQLGIPDVDEIVERLFPDGEVPEEEQPTERPAAEAMMVEAVKELRGALVSFLGEGTDT